MSRVGRVGRAGIPLPARHLHASPGPDVLARACWMAESSLSTRCDVTPADVGGSHSTVLASLANQTHPTYPTYQRFKRS